MNVKFTRISVIPFGGIGPISNRSERTLFSNSPASRAFLSTSFPGSYFFLPRGRKREDPGNEAAFLCGKSFSMCAVVRVSAI